MIGNMIFLLSIFKVIDSTIDTQKFTGIRHGALKGGDDVQGHMAATRQVSEWCGGGSASTPAMPGTSILMKTTWGPPASRPATTWSSVWPFTVQQARGAHSPPC